MPITQDAQPANSDNEWVDCWHCGGYGFSHHDCGEDTCCCLDPEDNVTCDTCMGIGGWYKPEGSSGDNQ